MEQRTKIIAEENKQNLHITREFNLPIELLYKAYTDAECLAEWMGTNVIKLDSKNHGSYRFETSFEGKVMFSANGTIHKMIENSSLIRTFEMENSNIGVQLEYLTFLKIDDNTSKLEIQIIYESEKHRAEQLKMPFAFGLNMAHDKLELIFKK